MKNKVFFDLETTGVSTSKDRIVEICIVKTDSNLNIIDKFYSLVKPLIPISVEASEVHGITMEKLRDSPVFTEIASDVLAFIEGSDIAGYNSNNFDIPMLMEELKRAELTLSIENVSLADIFQIERKNNPSTLSNVYKRYYGTEFDGAHGAEADVLATIAILRAQTSRYGLSKDFSVLESEMLEGKPRLDLGGKLTYINGQICWAIGKNKDLPVSTDKPYAQWFLKNDVPQDFKDILLKLI